MNTLMMKTSTALRLGIGNIFTVMMYRSALRSGLMKKIQAPRKAVSSPHFLKRSVQTKSGEGGPSTALMERVEYLLAGRYNFFFNRIADIGNPPDWFYNPITKQRCIDSNRHWSEIEDFNSGAGDIKVLWDLSRFSWALDLARVYLLTGQSRYLDILNSWVSSWTEANPYCVGPNWKCGQEAGLRMLHLLTASYLLGQHHSADPGTVRFVIDHCARITPTLPYALAQNNNHGTSEAAALFVGGLWLSKQNLEKDLRGRSYRWQKAGRRWLENRVQKLIAEDGSFSQYSVVYHRLLVDTLSMVEFWRRVFDSERFSDDFYAKARSAVQWLYQVVDPLSGDAPNLGPNDGTMLFNLSDCGYRDFRASVRLGAALFFDGTPYPPGHWDESLSLLGLDIGTPKQLDWSRASKQFKDGGYVLFVPNQSDKHTWAILKYANYRFRPNHADCMHFDLWYRGENLLRDAGSYSYNIKEPWKTYFSATKAHNTVEVDTRDQMPRIGRFLRGAWLNMQTIQELKSVTAGCSWSGKYVDCYGASHERTVKCESDRWQIIDKVDNCQNGATLRWRLAPGPWTLKGKSCFNSKIDLTVECSKKVSSSDLVDGWESRHYWQKSGLPVWEIQAKGRMIEFITTITLH